MFEAEIRLAQEAFERGDYAQSAQTFERLGAVAAARRGPRAPRFYILAARGWMHAGEPRHGEPLLDEGRRLALAMGAFPALIPLLARLHGEMVALGLNEQAARIASWLPEGQPQAHSESQNNRLTPKLPLKCASCGASVHPGEVEWLDETTAECAYCGSALRDE
jgi:hypothetical protein